MNIPSNAKDIEILLVEDNPGDVRLTQEAFKESKFLHQMHVVMDGEEALDFLHKRDKFKDVPTPDIVLLDLNLPKKHGTEVLAEIKNDQKLKVIPVVILTTSEAEEDIFELYKYIFENDSKESADYVYEQLREKIDSMEQYPERGHYPPELERIGVTGFLEIHFKPYRIIYEVDGRQVFIHAVLDGRRDIQSLLERRMFR